MVVELFALLENNINTAFVYEATVLVKLELCLSRLPNHFYAPPLFVAGYYVIPSELLSVRLSVRPSVRPSAVEHSCPLHNFDIVRDNFTKLGTNINHDQTTCKD